MSFNTVEKEINSETVYLQDGFVPLFLLLYQQKQRSRSSGKT